MLNQQWRNVENLPQGKKLNFFHPFKYVRIDNDSHGVISHANNQLRCKSFEGPPNNRPAGFSDLNIQKEAF